MDKLLVSFTHPAVAIATTICQCQVQLYLSSLVCLVYSIKFSSVKLA